MKKIVVLISNTGTGTNLQAIIDGVKDKKISAKILAVICDTKEALGLSRARKYKLKIIIVPKKEELLKVLKKLNPDFIALAGWKQIILDEVIKNPDGTDAVWNKGKMTSKAMQNFLDSKATYAGCTNHFLSEEFDFGIVNARCFEKIKDGDDVDSLYQRLKKKENKMYVDV